MTLSVIEPGCRTPPHRVRDDGSRDPCPTCDRQPLALARVVSRSWWRRLLAWRPWARAALVPNTWHTDQLRREAAYHREMEAWRAGDRSRPQPVMTPSGGMPCAR